MNNQQNHDADEAAARRLQAEIWLEDQEEHGAAGGGNNNEDLVRRLLGGDNNNIRNNNPPAGGGGNNNNDDDEEDEGMDEEDEEEEEEDDDEEDEDDENDAAADREAIDGGVAGDVYDEQRMRITRALKCPLVRVMIHYSHHVGQSLCIRLLTHSLSPPAPVPNAQVLYVECDEDLTDMSPNNPLLQRGATVYIGLDKGTKLNVVFQHYCDCVNKAKTNSPSKSGSSGNIKPTDLEFIHCATLDAQNTVEASAMMKNDRIRVVRERSKKLSAKAEMIRLQRESDRQYFKQLRQLLPNPSPEGMGCDVILESVQ